MDRPRASSVGARRDTKRLDIRLGGTTCLKLLEYLSNTASFVVYGITCLTRLIEFAELFTTFEEHMC